jgi:hypothetical protein
MDESVQLDPKVKVSDLDLSSLPLRNFHIIVVVEPDPETWAMPDDDMENLSELLKMYSKLIIDDAIGEIDPSSITVPISEDVKKTFIIMAGEGFGGDYYFKPVVTYSDFIVNSNNFEFEELCLLLDGIAKNYPTQNRVGIVGGMYGDEIIRAANAIQSSGFNTTIITRYCISEKVFVNLDKMIDLLNTERKRLLGDTDDDFDDE